MKFTTFMSTVAVFGGVASVELQGIQRTLEEVQQISDCMMVRYGERDSSSWTPEQCSNARWATTMRFIEADVYEYPSRVVSAVEHCRTANYYEELDFCEE